MLRTSGLQIWVFVLVCTMCRQGLSADGREGAITLLDISKETARQVVVAAGTKTDYRGQVNTVLMAGGKTMFAVWSIGHGGMCGPLKKSEDGGLTWSELQRRGAMGTAEGFEAGQSCHQGSTNSRTLTPASIS